MGIVGINVEHEIIHKLLKFNMEVTGGREGFREGHRPLDAEACQTTLL